MPDHSRPCMPQRRRFLQHTLSVTALGLTPLAWREALAGLAITGEGPYGPLQAADAHGVRLPAGFSARLIAEHRP